MAVHFPIDQWEFQDPKMELHHLGPYFAGIFPEIWALKIGQKYMLGTSNQSVPEMVDKCGKGSIHRGCPEMLLPQ